MLTSSFRIGTETAQKSRTGIFYVSIYIYIFHKQGTLQNLLSKTNTCRTHFKINFTRITS